MEQHDLLNEKYHDIPFSLWLSQEQGKVLPVEEQNTPIKYQEIRKALEEKEKIDKKISFYKSEKYYDTFGIKICRLLNITSYVYLIIYYIINFDKNHILYNLFIPIISIFIISIFSIVITTIICAFLSIIMIAYYDRKKGNLIKKHPYISAINLSEINDIFNKYFAIKHCDTKESKDNLYHHVAMIMSYHYFGESNYLEKEELNKILEKVYKEDKHFEIIEKIQNWVKKVEKTHQYKLMYILDEHDEINEIIQDLNDFKEQFKEKEEKIKKQMEIEKEKMKLFYLKEQIYFKKFNEYQRECKINQNLIKEHNDLLKEQQFDFIQLTTLPTREDILKLNNTEIEMKMNQIIDEINQAHNDIYFYNKKLIDIIRNKIRNKI